MSDSCKHSVITKFVDFGGGGDEELSFDLVNL
jgi:hypothetical protein